MSEFSLPVWHLEILGGGQLGYSEFLLKTFTYQLKLVIFKLKKKPYNFTPEKWSNNIALFLEILAAWGDFFDNGLLLYPVSDNTNAMLHSKTILSQTGA